MRYIEYFLFQGIVLIMLAPLVNGIIGKIKAFSQKRQGPPFLQLYYDLHKLFKKQTVVSDVSTWIFKVTPMIVFTTALCAAMIVPVVTSFIPENFPGDIIFTIYLLALGRFFMMAGALDTGSTFGGMGSSREALISSLAEPSLLISVITVALISGTTSVSGMMLKMQTENAPLLQPVYMMLFLAILLVILMDTSRIPVDDPSTHLELTMVHEAMILEYSGRNLALMELGAAIKQLLLITLVVNLFLPQQLVLGATGVALVVISLLMYIIKVIFVAVIIGLIEVSTVKFRFFSVPNIAALSLILSFLGFLQYFVLGR
ncbi:MAG: NADH-quinone oxidoreductase subunit H [Peptostreptococcaceae bacterium]|nr:NADH-quinone oxidoreductase subunit H [Peptostreptococcaceae bacterium]